jgi:DNA-binding XRE family transcriptional regulator
MDLREYLFYNRMQQKELAKLLGCNAKYLSHLINGRYKPGVTLARQIKEVTGVDMEPSTGMLQKRLRRTNKEAA